MDHARPHRSTMTPEMSTKNRGAILPAERGNLIGHADGHNTRNAFEEPDDAWGPGGCDPDNILGDGT